MGLDLIPESRAKLGHEAEWRRFIERAFADGALTEDEIARFREISVPAYAAVGAPRVGSDPAADAWVLEARKAHTPEDRASVLKEFDGYHVLQLVTCDGLSPYSHGGLYEGVDETTWTARFADEQCTKLAERQGAIVGKAPHNLRLRGGKPVRRQQGGQCPVALALRREDQEPQFFFCSHTAPLNSAGASTTCRRVHS